MKIKHFIELTSKIKKYNVLVSLFSIQKFQFFYIK
nr:MAG TPA: hypothetical protein [Caudoviricetes sp.]